MLKRDLQNVFYIEDEDIPSVLEYFCEVHGDEQKSYTVRKEHRARFKSVFDTDSDDESNTEPEGVPPEPASAPTPPPTTEQAPVPEPVLADSPVPALAPEPEPEPEPDWPLRKLVQRHAELRAAGETRSPCVLLTTGAMNPVHLGHVDMFARARRCLEEQHSYCVLGGYISPSHEAYVLPKCEHFKQQYLPTELRLECIRRAVADSDWLSVGAWEARQPGNWPDYPVVVEALQALLCGPEGSECDLSLGGNKCTVFYVCGLDHFEKCGLRDGLWQVKPKLSPSSQISAKAGVVATPRDDTPPAQTDLGKLVIGVEELTPGLSHLRCDF